MERGGPRRHGHLDLQYLNVHDMTYYGTARCAPVKKESTKYVFLQGTTDRAVRKLTGN